MTALLAVVELENPGVFEVCYIFKILAGKDDKEDCVENGVHNV